MRMPGSGSQKDAMNSIEAAIIAEKAASLGHAGYLLQKALDALNGASSQEEREGLTEAAASRAWAYLVQRELCGLRDNRQAVADYAIPAQVMARIGVRKPTKPNA